MNNPLSGVWLAKDVFPLCKAGSDRFLCCAAAFEFPIIPFVSSQQCFLRKHCFWRNLHTHLRSHFLWKRKLDKELRGLCEELREHRGLSRGKELACNQELFLALGVGILMSDRLDFNIALSLRPMFPIFFLCVWDSIL